jgi:hypothetical protein
MAMGMSYGATVAELVGLDAEGPIAELLHAAAELAHGRHRVADVDGEAADEAIGCLADVGRRLVVVDQPGVQELEGGCDADLDTGLVHLFDDLVEREPLPEALLDAVLPEDVPERVRPSLGGPWRHDRHPGIDGADTLHAGHRACLLLIRAREMSSRMISDVPAPIEKPATSR